MRWPVECKIFLAVEPISMKKSFDGLAVLAQEVLRQNPLGPHLFVFRNKPADKIKLLWWDRNGFVIWYKRLEKNRFRFPMPNKPCVVLTTQELELLLDGIDLKKLRRFPILNYEAVL